LYDDRIVTRWFTWYRNTI